MSPILVALLGLGFTVFIALTGAVVALLKYSLTLGRILQRLDTVERRPTTDNDCARELAKIAERLDGMSALFDEKINGLRELVHDGLKSRAHLRAVPKAKTHG